MATCPPINKLRPPADMRLVPNVLEFAATDIAGNQAFSVLIPWEKVLIEDHQSGSRAWTAPGGNRYWATSVPAITSNPMVAAILRLMADKSRKHFKEYVARAYPDLTMEALLERYRGKLATSYGAVKVEKQPTSGETVRAFDARGGYLLWIDPATGPFASKQYIDRYKPVWLSANITSTTLWGNYVPDKNLLEYSIRVEYKGTWTKIVGTLGKLNPKAFCDEIRKPEPQIAAGIAAIAYPASAPYIAGTYKACNVAFSPAPCETSFATIPYATPLIAGAKTGTTGTKGGRQVIAVYPGTATTTTVTLTPTSQPQPQPQPPSFQPVPITLWYQAPAVKSVASVAGVSLVALLAGLVLSTIKLKRSTS